MKENEPNLADEVLNAGEKFQHKDPTLEDPKLIRALEENGGDIRSAILGLMDDFDNPETRVIIARLIRKKNEADRVVH